MQATLTTALTLTLNGPRKLTVVTHVQVAKLLYEHGADLDAIDEKGHSTLHWASTLGKDDLVEFLCANGCDVHRVALPSLHTPLHWAALAQNAECVRFLLMAGGDPERLDSKGRTPKAPPAEQPEP